MVRFHICQLKKEIIINNSRDLIIVLVLHELNNYQLLMLINFNNSALICQIQQIDSIESVDRQVTTHFCHSRFSKAASQPNPDFCNGKATKLSLATSPNRPKAAFQCSNKPY